MRQPLDDENAWENVRFSKPSGSSGNTDKINTDMFELEIFDSKGQLLGDIPLDHFVDCMKIYGNRLFILDKLRKMCVYEYRIVDLED